MVEGKTRVAVVDDEESIRKSLARLMRSSDLEVETFPTGAEFLASLHSRQPCCVVLDLHMPGLSGFEVQARLVQMGMPLPVVIITGHHTDEARARVLAGGAAAYLLKPVDERVLLDAISAATFARDSHDGKEKK